MSNRYEATHSTGTEPMMLVFPEGCYEALPFEVRLMGPWYGCRYIDGRTLKPAQRVEIMRQGYTLLRDGEMRVRKAA